MMHFLKSWLLSAYWHLRAWMAGLPTIAGGTDVVELNVTTITELDSAIPELWTPKLRADAERMTFWGPNFEGTEGSGKPIITETAQTTLFAGNVADVASFGSSNVFTPDEIDRAKLQLMSLGALPFDVAMDNGQERPMYGIVVSEVSEYQLKSNSTWNQAQRDAGIRGEKNKIFTGALGIYNGVIIYVLPTIQVSHYKWGS